MCEYQCKYNAFIHISFMFVFNVSFSQNNKNIYLDFRIFGALKLDIA
jgi:hypothetical protein